MQTLTSKTVKLINSLEDKGDLELKLKKLLYGEIIRRLNQYEITDQYLTRKYGIDFYSFKKKKVVKKKNYSFEVEQDYWDWEMAKDGIVSMKSRLKEIGDIELG